jgi:hypothetical protein
MGAYHLPASIGRIRRLELLVDAGDGIHCEWKVRMQIALQGIMQVFKFLRAAIDLCHVAIERDKVRRLHDLLIVSKRTELRSARPPQAPCPPSHQPSRRALLSRATTSQRRP